MMRVLFVLLLCVVTAKALAGDEDDVRITFAAMGDVPYRPEERIKLAADLLKLPRGAAFAVHVGDIKPGTPFCREGEYAGIAQILRGSPVPVLVLPGDNEWNDCSRPDRAWGFWVRHFDRFESHWPGFGAVTRQPQQTANFAFERNRVLFVGLNVVGGRMHDPEEWRWRHEQGLAWLAAKPASADPLPDRKGGETAEAAVIFTHAQPSPATALFFDGLSRWATEFGRPVLLIHGDGHRWVKDRPFEAENVLRVQLDMGGVAPPLIVRVKRDRKDPFDFDRRKAR